MNKSFTFIELFNDSKGRTSLTKLIAFFAGVIGALVFISCAILMFVLVVHESRTDLTNILNSMLLQSVALITISLSALTARRFTQDKIPE